MAERETEPVRGIFEQFSGNSTVRSAIIHQAKLVVSCLDIGMLARRLTAITGPDRYFVSVGAYDLCRIPPLHLDDQNAQLRDDHDEVRVLPVDECFVVHDAVFWQLRQNRKQPLLSFAGFGGYLLWYHLGH